VVGSDDGFDGAGAAAVVVCVVGADTAGVAELAVEVGGFGEAVWVAALRAAGCAAVGVAWLLPGIAWA
jgi:hypothetical protein